MFYAVLSVCILVCAIAFARLWVAHHRLAEKYFCEAMARKLQAKKHKLEMAKLKEEQGVLRNLVLDILENEASIVGITAETPKAEARRRAQARELRRRELFAEAMMVMELEKVKTPVSDMAS